MRVYLAADDPGLVAAEVAGEQVADAYGGRPLRQERDVVLRRVGRPERVALDHLAELRGRPHDHAQVVTELGADRLADAGGQGGGRERGPHDHVAALDVGAHIRAADLLDEPAELGHRHLVSRAQVAARRRTTETATARDYPRR